jgi:hypothetical protein
MFDPFACASSLKANLLSYIASSLPVGNHASQVRLGDAFYNEWSRELFKGPFVEALPRYETCQPLSDEFLQLAKHGENPDRFWSLMNRAASIGWSEIERKSSRFVSARDRLWSPYPQEREAEVMQTSVQRLWRQQLYWHQTEAMRLICGDHRSVIVATGTGSGKTECYLLPLLRMVMTENPADRATAGVRAIVLFPMNALVEDQMRRLRKLLFWINLASMTESVGSQLRLSREITFGRYTGDTPISDTDSDRSKPSDNIHELGERVTRLEMRRTPPDILVTNFSMLEYALLRSDDQALFQNPRAFKLLVLDEVHTYSGTVGAEVAMLLRRFRANLTNRAKGRLTPPIFVGTSATVGSGDNAASDMAGFASRLFDSEFKCDQILLGRTKHLLVPNKTVTPVQIAELAEGLAAFASRKPYLLRLIAGHLSVDDEPSWESHIANDLEELAVLLDGCWSGMEKEIRDLDLLSHDPEPRSRELIGRIVQNSAVAHVIVDRIRINETGTVELSELARQLFVEGGGQAETSGQQTALSLMLTLLANATIKGRAIFPIRFHHFVTEKKEGLVCLNVNCRSVEGRESDGWWSRLYIQHGKTCVNCNALLFPLLICRKCGFAYLEAWRRGDGTCRAEKDDFEAKNIRFLFRPTIGLSQAAEDFKAKKRSLCLTCGGWFEAEEMESGAAAQAAHSSRCDNPRIIDIFEWSHDNLDFEMSECASCEQSYYADHEVVTPPTISPFGAATMFIEDLVSSSTAGHGISKLISFSDTRQQAAKLARSLQRTNRDYVFRQLIYQLLATASGPLTTTELLNELFKEIRYDDRKRQLLIDFPESVHSDPILEQTLADLIFREATSAYHTLETLGLVRIDYAPSILSSADTLSIPASWKKLFGEGSNRDFFRLILDWGFRFRHCVASAANKVPFRPLVLQRWKIFVKRVPGPKFDRKSQMEAVLFLERAESRNPLFNFFSRLRDRNQSATSFGPLDKSELNSLLEVFWRRAFSDTKLLTAGKTSVEADRELVAFRPGDYETGALQINLNSLIWTTVQPADSALQCDVCGRLSSYALGGVCPVRRCQGTLREIGHEEIDKRFSPTRHYRRLVRERELRPLRIEEHTAEIANPRRLEIEKLFRSEGEDAVDVISGSTTFELGVDLGSISTVFLANLPPRVSNYRQRAGRAGRREGMVPFVLSYVRERPHDQYFWRDLKGFISGPIPTPKFKLSSEEVLKRHGFSVVLAFVLAEYQKAGRPAGGLWGPLWRHVAQFLFQTENKASFLRRATESSADIHTSLCQIFEGINELKTKLSPVSIMQGFYERIKKMEAVLSAKGEEGCIKVLGDYGILPTYAFPIYVDELRLNEVLVDKSPRCDLELTRDRRISLVEYFPGRVVVAGKAQIQCRGIWAGYDSKPFRRCSTCGDLFFGANAPNACTRCGNVCTASTAIIPWGGYFGSVIGEGSPPEIEYEEVSSTEVIFDPAKDRPVEFRSIGRFLSVATIDANAMETARMRQFSPRPGSKRILSLERRVDINDVSAPHTTQTCLVLPEANNASRAESFYLLHEFPTDIVRVRISNSNEACAIQSSGRLVEATEATLGNTQKRTWIKQNFWLTLAEALLIASARFLDIDEGANAELGITFRIETSDPCLDSRELILFDTAPGGAGYSREIASNLKEVFAIAGNILSDCACGDSCYRCLRSYRNQWTHARLDRHLVAEGLVKFVAVNWS